MPLQRHLRRALRDPGRCARRGGVAVPPLHPPGHEVSQRRHRIAFPSCTASLLAATASSRQHRRRAAAAMLPQCRLCSWPLYSAARCLLRLLACLHLLTQPAAVPVLRALCLCCVRCCCLSPHLPTAQLPSCRPHLATVSPSPAPPPQRRGGVQAERGEHHGPHHPHHLPRWHAGRVQPVLGRWSVQ